MRLQHRLRSEAGVTLIMVGLMILTLMFLSAFVLDEGVLWLARARAQNAADAGALAGATSRAFDDLTDPPLPGGIVEQAALAAVEKHTIWVDPVQAGSVDVNYTCPKGSVGGCVEVRVYQDGTNGSPRLPTFFATVLSIQSQGVKAIANAQAANANATDCLKPWLIPDKWIENSAPATTFNGADVYTPPTLSPDGTIDDPGTGWSVADIGTELTLKEGDPNSVISPSDYYEIGEAEPYEEEITGCALNAQLGDEIVTLPGNRKGPTKHAVSDLTANGPVVVPVGMFSPAEYMALDRQSGRFDLHIVNMMGFRITSVDNNGTVHGTIVSAAGFLKPGPQVGGGSSLLKAIVLVR